MVQMAGEESEVSKAVLVLKKEMNMKPTCEVRGWKKTPELATG